MDGFEVEDRALVASDSFFGAIVIVRSVDKEARTVTASLPWGYEKTFSFDELRKVVKGVATSPPETRLTSLRKMFMGDSIKVCARFLCLIHGHCASCPMRDYGKPHCVTEGWVEWLKGVRTLDDDVTRSYAVEANRTDRT